MKTTSGINPRVVIWLLFATGAAILALSGCNSNVESGFATEENDSKEVIFKPEPLKLLAIGVPSFGEDIAKQWAAERDGELQIEHLSLEAFDSNSDLPSNVDLLVHPFSINVDLITKNIIRVFPRDMLVSEEMNQDGFMLHFRKALVRHDDKTWAVSLGGHQLRLLYRSDVLEAAKIQPPETWEDLSRAIEKLENSDAAKDLKTILIPTSDQLAGQMFMAKVASQIRDQGKLTSFFDRKTMKPTITAPPFESALTELKSLASESDEPLDVSEVFQKFAAGESVFAIAWPVGNPDLDAQKLESDSANWGISRLPGSPTFYDVKQSNWQKRNKRDDFKVDFLGTSANNISIAAGTSNAKDAANFVAWIADKKNSQKLLPNVGAPFRATHLARIGQWYSIEQADRQFLDALADSIEQTHESKIFLMFPQLPGKRQYLKLLDQAITDFLSNDDADAKKTLERVATQWEELTDSLGRDQQTKELRRGNGI